MKVYYDVGGSAGNLLGNPLCTNFGGGGWGKALAHSLAFSCKRV